MAKNKIKEGKTINNKYYFRNQDYKGDQYEVIPGQKVRTHIDNQDELEQEIKDMKDEGVPYDYIENFKQEQEKILKHNDRRSKYGSFFIPMYGDSGEIYRTVTQKKQREKNRENIQKMLKFWGINYNEYKTLPNSEKIVYWNCYWDSLNKNESKNMDRKNTIRLTESELKRVITESVKNILKEYDENYMDPDITNEYSDNKDAQYGFISNTLEKVLDLLFELESETADTTNWYEHSPKPNKYQEINDWAKNTLKMGNQLFVQYFN